MMEKVGARLRDIIETYPSTQIEFIIETLDDSKSLERLVESKGGKFLGRALNKYVAVEIQAGLVRDLIKEPQIAKIWYVDPRIFISYFNAIKGVEYTLSFSGRPDCPAVVNMSLGPPIDRPGELHFDPNEPFNVATKRLYEAGIVTVVAVGNSGRMGNDTLNPWSVAPWVIGVGAATKDGKKLADFSSRGKPSDELYRPTLVAPGVDIETAHPTNAKKTPEQLSKDKQFIAEDMLDRRTIVSGTSFAAANISGAVGDIIGFMRENCAVWENKRAEVKIAFENYKKTFSFEIGSPAYLSPSNIKRLLTQCAIPMPKYQPHEVGAGFISQNITAKLFGDYKAMIMPIKIVNG